MLLRLANLGYQQHAMQLPGIPMHVVGQDASLLRNGGVGHLVLDEHALHRARRGARRALRRAGLRRRPAVRARTAAGSYNVYYFKNRDWRRLSNNGAPGPGGMMTEVRVYQTAAARPDRREPDLCLSSDRAPTEGRPR